MERKKFTNDDIVSMLDDMSGEQRTEALDRFQCLYQTKTVEETVGRMRDFLNLYLNLYLFVFDKVKAVFDQMVEVITITNESKRVKPCE